MMIALLTFASINIASGNVEGSSKTMPVSCTWFLGGLTVLGVLSLLNSFAKKFMGVPFRGSFF